MANKDVFEAFKLAEHKKAEQNLESLERKIKAGMDRQNTLVMKAKTRSANYSAHVVDTKQRHEQVVKSLK